MLTLYLQAPFGVFRAFTTGSFRVSSGFITPSAAYGLILNLAGVEMRRDDGKSSMTLMRSGLPAVNLALGAMEIPLKHVIYQQLHNYRVGQPDTDEDKKRVIMAKTRKWNVLPVHREVLSNIRAYICIDGNPELETSVIEGLAGKRSRSYGLPFLGDNNFLIDRLEAVDQRQPAYWYERVEEDIDGIREHLTRLTVTINRQDMAITHSQLFAPTEEKSQDPPEKAWIQVQYS